MPSSWASSPVRMGVIQVLLQDSEPFRLLRRNLPHSLRSEPSDLQLCAYTVRAGCQPMLTGQAPDALDRRAAHEAIERPPFQDLFDAGQPIRHAGGDAAY